MTVGQIAAHPDDDLDMRAQRAFATLIREIREVAPSVNPHGYVPERYWGNRPIDNRMIVYLTLDAAEADKVQWSVLFDPLRSTGCTQFHVSQCLYDNGQGMWSGYDLTGQEDEIGLALERGDIAPSSLPFRKRFLEIGITV